MRILALRCALLAAVLGAGFLGRGADGLAAESRIGWIYRVRANADLTRIDVRLCFRTFLPRRMVLTDPRAYAALDLPRRPDGGRLERRDDGVAPVGAQLGSCVEYAVDVRALTAQRRHDALAIGRDLLIRPGLFLLGPARWPDDVHATLVFELPEGLRASVCWPRARGSGHHRLDRFALQSEGRVAFGRFQPVALEAAGATFEMSVLDAEHRATPAGLERWLRGAAGAVAQLYGRFPRSHVHVLVHPVATASPQPVVFGQAMQACGATVHVLLSAHTPDAALVGEWVGVHELTHLGMPATRAGEDWLQEGFVTYYQEVLRTRAGFQNEREGWQELHDGFGRGRRSGTGVSLADESRSMRRTHAYHRVYWGGAALALELDLAIRKQWPGQRSLDDVMRFLLRRHGGRVRSNEGMELMRAADGWLGRPVCAPLAERHLRATRFPDLRDAYRVLGLRVGPDSRIDLVEDAPQAADRGAIMAPRAR